jgi:putative CocE/NonD family hydrolase
VPYRDKPAPAIEADYMVGDQRFAARRPDVLVYQTEPLATEVTLAGPLEADLVVTSTGTDADFIVKLIDVYPPDVVDPEPNPTGVRLAGYQQLVRGEVMRAKFRQGFSHPEPLVPGEVSPLRFALPDVNHTFRAGHRIMVQVQSSWFPLVDRNPQTFVDIYAAKDADFRSASLRVLRTPAQPSSLKVTVVRGQLP